MFDGIPQAREERAEHCALCGCTDVVVDAVEALTEGAELLLGECVRCEHRWTRTVTARVALAPATPERAAAIAEAA